ncbi:MAG: hypothetical protein LBC64_03810 [Fibromonadaceae bacterium]|jgi:hypothetical protein|nr:hypothetical protein [Fibromonadaceae bacterium]
MKFNLYLVSLAIALCISLFFACTSELELPPSPDEYVEPPSSSVSQDYCVSDTEKQCLPAPEDGHCSDGWHLLSYCPYNNSSSSNTGSSSSNNIGSSSSSDNSSSSNSIILVTGDFDFRLFGNSASSNRIYFLNTTNVYVSITEGGNGKLLSTLAITDAAAAAGCDDDIAYKITGGGLTDADIPVSRPPAPSPTGLRFTEPGEITAVAVVTCNDEEIILKEVTARVVPDPTLTACPAQILPSTYVAKTKKEYVKDIISVRDDLGERCGDVTYALGTSPTTSPDSDSLSFASNTIPTGQRDLTITASVQCTGVTVPSRSCPVSVFVANNYIKFEDIDVRKPFSTGTTVIELLDTYGSGPNPPSADKFGCGSPSISSVQFKLNNGAGQTIGSWKEVQISTYPPDYKTNGNRILVEMIGGTAECLVATWP